jgi:metallo-beta-lactamase class B
MIARTVARHCALLVSLLLFALAAPLSAEQNPDWTRPFPPFRIAGNSPGSPRTGPWGGLYYVGSADLASYLIATPQGLILINSDLVQSPPLIRKSVEQLGFKFTDIKILLISHAHSDHCGGSAQILKLTGAKYFVMAGDVPVVESGGRADFQYGRDPSQLYPPAHVDRILHDRDTVRLGGVILTAHLTAGHTRGTTTWTLDIPQDGRTLHVVIVGSPNVNPGYKLVGNHAYPQIAADYRRGFAVLESLPCDIFLGAHGGYFGLKEKYARFASGDKNAFIDPAGYKAYIAERDRTFEAELARQSHAR